MMQVVRVDNRDFLELAWPELLNVTVKAKVMCRPR